MKKNDIFTFTAPNGVEVTAVVLSVSKQFNNEPHTIQCEYVCYSQNRLFTCKNIVSISYPDIEKCEYCDRKIEYGEVIVDYAVLPDYDAMLERYSEIQIAQAETNLGM